MHRHGDYNFNDEQPDLAPRAEEVKEEEIKEAQDATQDYIDDKKDLKAAGAVKKLANIVLMTCSYFV